MKLFTMSRPISAESAYRAIADPIRRRIIELLALREMTPAELAQVFTHVGRQTLTFHLRVLVNTGLASQRRRKLTRLYRAHPQRLQAVADWVNRRLLSTRS